MADIGLLAKGPVVLSTACARSLPTGIADCRCHRIELPVIG
jgi:hypothetical protein